MQQEVSEPSKMSTNFNNSSCPANHNLNENNNDEMTLPPTDAKDEFSLDYLHSSSESSHYDQTCQISRAGMRKRFSKRHFGRFGESTHNNGMRQIKNPSQVVYL